MTNLRSISPPNIKAQHQFSAIEADKSSPPPNNGRPTVFVHTLCPYAERVFIAMLETQQNFDLVHIDLSTPPSWYGSINPAGLVPAIRDADGTTRAESLDLLEWIARDLSGTSGNSNKLGYDHPQMKAAIKAGSAVVSAGLSLVSGKTGRYWGTGKGQSKSQIDAFEKELEKLFALRGKDDGPYILGNEFSLADIALFPFMNRFAIVLPNLCGYKVENALHCKVGLWLNEVKSRESCQISSPNDELFRKASKEHGSLDFFDYVTYGIFDCHPQNQHYLN